MENSAPNFSKDATDFQNWKDAVCDAVIDLDCRRHGGGPFQGRIDCRSLRETRIIRVTASAHSVNRDRQRISRCSDDYVILSHMIQGHATVVQSGREAHLAPGDFAICDTSLPYLVELNEPFQLTCLRMDRKIFGRHVGQLQGMTARAVSGRQGTGRIASQLISEASRQLDEISELSGRRLNEALLGLVAAAVAEVGNGPTDSTSEPQHLLMQRAMRLVEDELGNDTLSCEFVAQRLGISYRYLRKVFARRGVSLSELIWDRRLMEAQRQLASPCAVRASITTIAFACGFKDSAHFSRAFRTRFGISPRQFRQAQA